MESFSSVLLDKQSVSTNMTNTQLDLFTRTSKCFLPDYIKYNIDIEDMLNKFDKDIYVIAMEECSELQIALGTYNTTNIIEECVDLLFIINWFQIVIKKDIIVRRNFSFGGVQSQEGNLVLSSCIKLFSKVYRGVIDTNSPVVEDTINSLAVLVFELLTTFGTPKDVIANWISTKVAKIEQNYRDDSQH